MASNIVDKPSRQLTSHYSNTCLFDKDAKSKLNGLILALQSSYQFDEYDESEETANIVSDVNMKQPVVSEAMFCNCCQYGFADREEQSAHYRCDWHRYNLHLRLKGLKCVSEDEFELVSGDVSSISGSEESSDEEGTKLETVPPPLYEIPEETSQPMLMKMSGHRLDKIFFKNEEGELLSLYKCLFNHKKGPGKSSSDIISTAFDLLNQQKWAVMMISSGHFAGALFNGNSVVEHKTFHRYTVRAKRGSAQSARDSQGNAPKSAGATLRRYNEAALSQEVQDLLTSWKSHLDSCSLIFVRIPVLNRAMFYGGKTPALKKDDFRIRIIPFPTRRPTLSEVKRVHHMLSTIECYGQEKDVQDVIPLSPQRFYCKDTDKLEIRPPSPPKAKTTKSKSHHKDVTEASTDSESEDGDEFDINPVGPGNPLKEFEIYIEKKGNKKKTKSSGTPDSTSAEQNGKKGLIDSQEMDLRNALFTACKTGSAPDFEKTISDLNVHFNKKCQTNEIMSTTNTNDETSSSLSADVSEKDGFDEVASSKSIGDGETLDSDMKVKVKEVADQDTESKANTTTTDDKVIAFLNEPIGDCGNRLLHIASQEDEHEMVTSLLLAGADPVIKNDQGKVPYFVGGTECKNAYRRFMAKFPHRYNYKQAQVPSPLTPEMEASKKQKNAERRAVKKKSMHERNKVKKAEESKLKVEKAEKDRFLKLSDREKRALAAEKRILEQCKETSSKPVLSRCYQCGADITGKIPFEYSEYKFCSTKCLRDHRAKPTTR